MSEAAGPSTSDQLESAPHLYLIYCEQPAPVNGWEIAGCIFRASDDICLLRTTLSRSRVYHTVKRQIEAPVRLLIAPLSGDPKFMGMARGTLAWLRRIDEPDYLA